MVVDFLTSDRVREAVDLLTSEPTFDPVRHVTWLRRRFDAEQAAAIAELVAGRPLARSKFGALADRMLYTVEAIRQATPLAVARHRATRLGSFDPLVDLGCGIGGDAMGIGGTVIGVDIDATRLAMARHNVGLVGGVLRGVRSDIRSLIPFDVPAGFADPGRRDERGRRIYDVESYRPPLGVLVDRWARHLAAMAIKVHPGIRHQDLPDEAEAEFVSLDRDMREACLWFGEARTGARTRATVLPSGVSIHGVPLAVSAPVTDIASWLFEPDPAVLRAGLVGDLAARFELAACDRTIAYLTGDTAIDTPLLTGYPVEHVLPFNAKHIRSYLRQRRVGSVVVKKRGSVVDPEQFRRSLRLSGENRRVVILTRARGQPTAVICHDAARSDQSGRA